jgi:hypothetical protein
MHNRRRKKLIEPRLQLKFSLAFLATAFLLVMVQAIVLAFLLQRVADRLPNDGLALQAEAPRVLLYSFLATFALLAPLSLAVGVRTTHPVVGPIYRFRVYLGQLARGERPGPCRIREDDELQDLCALLNEATAPLRQTSPDSHEAQATDVDAPPSLAARDQSPTPAG